MIASLLLSVFLIAGEPVQGDFLIMFWNLENFFDWHDGGLNDSDKEFSSYGSRHWSRNKFYAKSRAVAKTLLWVADKEGNMPDVFAVAEIENRFVLKSLLDETILRKFDYEIVHYDSPDPRGIDVALIYRRSSLRLLHSSPIRVSDMNTASGTMALRTRDILLAEFLRENGDSLAILVNHHPSKYGGGDTDWRRKAALGRLKAVKDSLEVSGYKYVVATGDFNDTPENTVFDGADDMVNLALPLSLRGEGTIRFNGRWELIDMFMVTPSLRDWVTMDILHVPFLTVWDNTHSGDKPLRTYSGPRYIGGVSDHCPILLRISR